MLDKTCVHDAVSGSFDPTKTHAIRKRFKTDFQKRWVALAKLSTQALTNKDLLGIDGHTAQSIMYGGDKIKTFQEWIDEALKQVIIGNNGTWVDPYLINTHSHAMKTSKIPVFGSTYHDVSKSLPLLISSTKVELKGIMEAASQQASRQVFNGLMARSQASKIARDVSTVIKTVGQRTNGLVDFMVVKTFNESLLDVFEHAGIKQVGVIPEHVPIKIMQDAASKKKRSNVFKSTFKSRAQFQEVDILTAGDQKVCLVCQKAAANGPYSIAEARGLVPLHFSCRCSLVQAGDLPLFAHGQVPEKPRRAA